MAYAASITYGAPVSLNGRRVVVVRVVETEAAAGSEYAISGAKIPRIGTITTLHATLVSGTGTTIQPKLGRKPGFTVDTSEHIDSQAAAAANIRETTPLKYNLAPQDDLVVRSTPNNAAADHTITTEYVITEGHE